MKKINVDNIDVKESNVLEVWASKYGEVQRWLSKLQAKTFSAMKLYYYCYWTEKTPTELLSLKKDANSKEADQLLDTFMASDVGVPEAVKFNVSIAVRSFYKHNYTDLSKGAGIVSYQKQKPYWKPNKEDLRKLYRFMSNPRDRSVLTLLCSTGIAHETLANLKWKHLEEGWEQQQTPHIGIPTELVKGHGRGRYKGVEQHTFLTPESKRDLIEYRDWMEKKLGRKLTSEDSIYWTYTKPLVPLTYKSIGYLFLHNDSGVKFSPHDARRFVETALEEIRINPNWARKIRGRKVRGEEAPYSRPAIEQLRSEYQRAVPLLEFTSEAPRVDVKEMEIKNIINAAIASGHLLPEKAEDMRKLFRQKRASPEQAALMINKAWLESQKDCTDGEHCQRIVEEGELPELLAAGWKFVATLPSGKVVVANEE